MMDFSVFSKEKLNKMNRNTLMETLGIEFIEGGDNLIKAKMPVDQRTHQPMGLLHGGASAALIESIGSLGSALLCDLNEEYPVGLDVNANHIGGINTGYVIGIGKLIHGGKKTHVWQVDIFDESNDKLVCTGRLTVMVIQKK
jgi:1,4-dihydroxy-2-naphthoyl-CoA hydrolase